jgi:hypothetical protein
MLSSFIPPIDEIPQNAILPQEEENFKQNGPGAAIPQNVCSAGFS